MCCQGCRAAAEWIEQLGLADYYRLRTAPAQKTGRSGVRSTHDSWQSADNARHVIRDLGADLRETLLLIEGVRCTACVWLIERALGAMPGVVSVQVNAVARRARVIWRDSTVTLPQLLQALSRTGYQRAAARRARPRRSAAPRVARRAQAIAGRRLRRDAGHDVCHRDLSRRRGVARCVHARAAALAGPAGRDAGGPLFRAAVLRGRIALVAGAPGRHGRAGGTGHRGRVRRQCHRSAARQRRGVLRFDLDVRVLPARRPLPGNARAASRARSHRCAGQAHAAVRRSPARGRNVATGRHPRAARGRLRARRRRRHRAGRRRAADRALPCGRGAAQRRVRAGGEDAAATCSSRAACSKMGRCWCASSASARTPRSRESPRSWAARMRSVRGCRLPANSPRPDSSDACWH